MFRAVDTNGEGVSARTSGQAGEAGGGQWGGVLGLSHSEFVAKSVTTKVREKPSFPGGGSGNQQSGTG